MCVGNKNEMKYAIRYFVTEEEKESERERQREREIIWHTKRDLVNI